MLSYITSPTTKIQGKGERPLKTINSIKIQAATANYVTYNDLIKFLFCLLGWYLTYNMYQWTQWNLYQNTMLNIVKCSPFFLNKYEHFYCTQFRLKSYTHLLEKKPKWTLGMYFLVSTPKIAMSIGRNFNICLNFECCIIRYQLSF